MKNYSFKQYISEVYEQMSSGIFVSAMISVIMIYGGIVNYLLASDYATIFFWSSVVIQLGLVWYISSKSFGSESKNLENLFYLYCLSTGATTSLVLANYKSSSIFVVFILSSLIFYVLSLSAKYVKFDLTKYSAFFLFALLALILGGVYNIFFYSGTLDLIVCCVGLLVFAILIVYDYQVLKNSYENLQLTQPDNFEAIKNNQVTGSALAFYLDFINIFLYLLRLLGDRK